MFDLFLPLAFMLSPGALIAAGNGIGFSGLLFGIFLVIASLCALLTTGGMGHPAECGPVGKTVRAFGLGIIGASRMLACGALGILWLSEAGYSANELIAPWLPPAACTFTLLGLIGVAALLARTYRGAILYVATLLALATVGYVMAMATQPHGLEAWFPTMFPQKTPPLFPSDGDAMQGAYMALLALLGFDLASRPDAAKGTRRALLSLLLILTVFGIYLWGGLSATDPFDLAHSTVPHLLVAGLSLGGKGKQIMGIAILCGTFSAILALVCVNTRHLLLLVRTPEHEGLRRLFSLLLCTGCTALLALGWATEPRLAPLVNAAILCWFAGYAVIQCSLILRGVVPPLAILALLIYIFAGWMTFQRVTDIQFFLYAVSGIALCGLILSFSAFSPPAAAPSAPQQDTQTPPAQPTKS